MVASVLALWSRRVSKLLDLLRDSPGYTDGKSLEQIVFDTHGARGSPNDDPINSGPQASLAQW